MQINYSNTTKLRVRYGETDQMGYCYYGNYAQYFEVGRVEALRNIGMTYKEMEDKGIMLPVSEFSVKYFHPAYYDQELLVSTKITQLIGSRLYFDYEIHNSENKLISNATTILVFVSKTSMRPIKPPADFLELISKYEVK